MQAAAAIVLGLCCASCSDTWDDHYSEASEGMINTTLWQAINSNSDLSNFAKVAKACGYDVALDGSQTFTVFAPTNASLTGEQADSLIEVFNEDKAAGVKTAENRVVKQFLQNHIALYKKSASSISTDSITMMNGKYQILTQSEIGGENFQTKNVLYNNGILYTLGGQIKYEPNIFEYLAMDHDLDSVYNFIKSYGKYKFDASQSVAGGVVDGKTQYLDSVTIYTNKIISSLGYINSEDSTYWMVAPTNCEWKRLVEEYTPYFNYDTKVDNRDSLQYANTRLAIINGAFFSRTNNKDAAIQDSVVSTSSLTEEMFNYNPTDRRYYHYYKPFASGGIFEGTNSVDLSNGRILKAADYRINKFETFLQEQKVEAENTYSAVDTLTNAIDPITVRTVLSNNPFYNQVSGNSFVEISADAVGAQPAITYKVSNVLANVGYDVYAVFVPALAYDTLATADQRLPVKFRAQVGCQQSGVTKWERASSFTTKADVVDTIKIKSNFKFKTTSFGLDEPQTKVKIYTDVPIRESSKYQTTMRLDCIIVKPHDAPAIEAKAKRYKKSY